MPEQQPMFEDQEPDLTEQIAEIRRELAMRRNVYPRWIERGQIDRETAGYRIRCMEATLHRLRLERDCVENN